VNRQYTLGLARGAERVLIAVPRAASVYSHVATNSIFGNNRGCAAVMNASAGMTGLCSNTYPQETINGFPNRAAADR
jgi:hypothetical protein